MTDTGIRVKNARYINLAEERLATMPDTHDPRTLLNSIRHPADDTATGPTEVISLPAVAWGRVSTDMQDARGLSLPEQLKQIEHYAAQHGYTILARFQEVGSAYHDQEKRVEFQRMLAFARQHRCTILVHEISRFSRDMASGKLNLQQLRRDGIDIIFITGPQIDPETPMGSMMENINLSMQEFYSRTVAEHTIKGSRANIHARDPESGHSYKNGGQPLFGYQTKRLKRGEERPGHDIIKSIWVLDETLVNGRPIHEWARDALLMAMQGASLAQIRDFLMRNGIPGRRKAGWGISTINSLLDQHILLKYAGHEVWYVHDDRGRIRPESEWEVEPNAHPALLTEEEVQATLIARQESRQRGFDRRSHQSRKSDHLLTGGMMKCTRCGNNFGHCQSGKIHYYRCGTFAYRRGYGCGPSLYLNEADTNQRVLTGLFDLMDRCADQEGFARRFNAQVAQRWQDASGYDPHAERKMREIDQKIARLRQAVEDGLQEDMAWVNQRIRELKAEQAQLASGQTLTGAPPQIDIAVAKEYQKRAREAMLQGEHSAQVKRMIRTWVKSILVNPDERVVEIAYQVPVGVITLDPGADEGTGVNSSTCGSGGRFRTVDYRWRDLIPGRLYLW